MHTVSGLMPVCALDCMRADSQKAWMGVLEHTVTIRASGLQPEEGGAESLQKQDSSNAQQDRSTADADKEQSDMDSQQESKSGAQQSEEKGVATPQQDGEGSRMAGQLADTDVSSDRQEQKEGGDSGGRGAGIWVIDLTVDDPEALQDGEDTYMVCPMHLALPCICSAYMHACTQQTGA